MLTYHRSSARFNLPDNERTNLNKYIQQKGGFDCFKYTILQETLSFSIEYQIDLKKHWIDKLQPSLNIIQPKKDKMEWTAEERAKKDARAEELRELKKRSQTLPLQAHI